MIRRDAVIAVIDGVQCALDVGSVFSVLICGLCVLVQRSIAHCTVLMEQFDPFKVHSLRIQYGNRRPKDAVDTGFLSIDWSTCDQDSFDVAIDDARRKLHKALPAHLKPLTSGPRSRLSFDVQTVSGEWESKFSVIPLNVLWLDDVQKRRNDANHKTK
jgi:hypothetical protein